MKKTVSEIAQELDISRQAVHQLMDKLPGFREKYVTKDGRKFLVDEKGVALLHESRQVGAAPMSSASSDDVKHVKQTQLDEVDKLDEKEDHALDDLDKENDEKDQADLLAFYQEQLQAKDEQLAARAKEVDDLHRLLENSQKLQLIAEQRNKELKERIAELGGYLEHKDPSQDEKVEKNSSSSTSSTSSQPSPTPKKKGFFARLFGGD
ncbi:hypothetical protein SH898_001850 [Campylobacter jejuni]|nr:hypothetical protein [Campylobacter jejuni]